MKKLIFLPILFLAFSLLAQENITYQQPPEEILKLVDVELAPGVYIDDKKEHMLLLYRDAYKSIEELSQEEMRLAGLRIDPKTNIGSRTSYYNNIRIKYLESKDLLIKDIEGMPQNPRLANLSFSPDQQFMAMTNTTSEGVELWLLDIKNASMKKLTGPNINANMRSAVNWFEDGKNLLVKMVPADRKELVDAESAIPVGPTISVNDGKKAQNRTYQDLLKNKNDEFNFEQLARSELYRVSVEGEKERWLESDMYTGIDFSPDGRYVMVTTIAKPFSYLVPYYRFPSKTTIYTQDAAFVETLVEVPLIEDLPQGFMAVRTGKRSFDWRNDKPATLVFAMALDEGDPENEVDFRDEVFELEEPFNGTPRSILKTINRYSGIRWGDDKTAIAYDYWWNNRNTKTYVFDPSDPGKEAHILFDRNYQDRYSDPGNFVSKRNEYGSSVLDLQKAFAYLTGPGYTEEGQFPFVDRIDLESGEKKRLYTSPYTDKRESISDFDVKDKKLLVRIESPTEYPNYYFKNLKNDKIRQITFFSNPFLALEEVEKEVIKYKREDGVELSGTLYLPAGYDKEKKEKMPMIIWAYPTEYKDRSTAGQNTNNPNAFTYPYYGSMVYWVTRGYVVLDNASFPIVGEGDEEPNDTFIPQLVANAEAAIKAVNDLGYIDPERVAIGGHSYGAFMVANLLSHSDLFAAGIARSGAYNRSLTPFGFQSEERTYWDAPEIYYEMSPFMHADEMKYPLLLIHGEADNNSGTYPMQSERYFNALKGLGATVRLVILPKESHGYRAKESVLHLLWEQDEWLEKYVKNR
ncbi:MAG: prolyl oligopeptidase family serine peptidase [Bacteroidales bacterium]|jgi:dipeptidyl aminopeptidase/acylaminoacyl peptidase|nr:prolyl oligopeptidase family serine peptidase [Bacteroidales bacterium]